MQEAIPRLVKLDDEQPKCTLTVEQSEAFDRQVRNIQLLKHDLIGWAETLV